MTVRELTEGEKLIERFESDYFRLTGKIPIITIKDGKGIRPPLMTLHRIVSTYIPNKYKVDGIFNISTDRRYRDIVDLRIIYCYIAKRYGYSIADISRQLDKDHTSIIHLEKQFLHLYNNSEGIRKLYNKVSDHIKECKFYELVLPKPKSVITKS